MLCPGKLVEILYLVDFTCVFWNVKLQEKA